MSTGPIVLCGPIIQQSQTVIGPYCTSNVIERISFITESQNLRKNKNKDQLRQNLTQTVQLRCKRCCIRWVECGVPGKGSTYTHGTIETTFSVCAGDSAWYIVHVFGDLWVKKAFLGTSDKLKAYKI